MGWHWMIHQDSRNGHRRNQLCPSACNDQEKHGKNPYEGPTYMNKQRRKDHYFFQQRYRCWCCEAVGREGSFLCCLSLRTDTGQKTMRYRSSRELRKPPSKYRTTMQHMKAWALFIAEADHQLRTMLSSSSSLSSLVVTL